MGKKPTLIPVHGTMLKGIINATMPTDEFAKQMEVSRQSVHLWVTSGRISPANLSKAVKILNLTAEDVRLLGRTEQTILEKRLSELRECKATLVDIRKLINNVLGEP